MIIRLANRYIEINNLYHFIVDYCSDYVIKDTKKLPIPDFSIKVDIEDIDFERGGFESGGRLLQIFVRGDFGADCRVRANEMVKQAAMAKLTSIAKGCLLLLSRRSATAMARSTMADSEAASVTAASLQMRRARGSISSRGTVRSIRQTADFLKK